MNRRRFMRVTGAASVAGIALGLGGQGRVQAAPGAPVLRGPNQEGPTPDEMDAMHEKGVKAFMGNVGKDPNFWGVPLQPRIENGVKIFDITVTAGPWETEPGVTMDAMMYNGRVPGPYIRVTQGDKIRVNVKNQMKESTSVHFHGVHTPKEMDGVPFISQPPIKSGQTFAYEFTAKNPGTHMYHSHHNAAEQVTKGLMGAFIIDPFDTTAEPKVVGDYMLVLNDAGIGMTLNGKSFPATQPIVAKKGDRIRIRYMNEGLQIHPMHLHGMYQQVFAKDGVKLPAPYLADTLTVGPGERYDVLVDCEEPGVWAFHCHILTHAESNHGMFGMVTALVIT